MTNLCIIREYNIKTSNIPNEFLLENNYKLLNQQKVILPLAMQQKKKKKVSENTIKQTTRVQKDVGGQWIDEEQKYRNERISPVIDQCLKMKKMYLLTFNREKAVFLGRVPRKAELSFKTILNTFIIKCLCCFNIKSYGKLAGEMQAQVCVSKSTEQQDVSPW